MLNKLLFKYQRRGQMIIAFLGTLLGTSFLLISIQFYYDLQSVLQKEEDVFGPNTFILQKKVSAMNTLSIGDTYFSNADVTAIEKEPYVKKLDVFKTSAYDVSIKMASTENLPYFRTDAFVQTLPKKYFSDVDAKWSWNPDADYIPLVMPEDYLTLYNHAFAPSQGTPQIPKDALFEAALQLEIKRGDAQNKKFNCKIVGLTNKVNSIIVPGDFLDYSNEKFGVQSKKKPPNRIVIQTMNDSYQKVQELIKDEGLETSKTLLDQARIKTYLSITMVALLVVNFVILTLSLLAFTQYSQIVVYKTEYEIKTLLRLGYSTKKITMTYLRFFALLFGIIALISVLLVLLFKFWSQSFMAAKGFDIPGGMYALVFIAALALSLIFTLFNWINIQQLIKRLL